MFGSAGNGALGGPVLGGPLRLVLPKPAVGLPRCVASEAFIPMASRYFSSSLGAGTGVSRSRREPDEVSLDMESDGAGLGERCEEGTGDPSRAGDGSDSE